MRERGFEVAIIGGGIVGCAVADELSRRGCRPLLVLDRGLPGHGASRAALGGLPPSLEPAPNDQVARLYRRSLDLFPAWTAALKAETGVDPEFLVSGSLLIAPRPDDLPGLDGRYEWLIKMGWAAQRLTQDDLRRVEPAFAGCLGGLLMPEDARINNARLLDALVHKLVEAGVTFRTGYAASLWTQSGTVCGVHFGSDRIAARFIVNAAGAGAGEIGGPPLPIFGVRGQALAVQTSRLPSERMVASPHCYFVPRKDGSLVLGSTVEPRITESVVTVDGVHRLLDAGRALWPELDRSSFLRAGAGIRPASADHLPVIGRWPALPNLFVAAGFFKMGITLAPLAARTVADLLLGKANEPILDILSPARFVRGERSSPRER